MSPPPRSLSFAVSTSLLTASLALAGGCDDKQPTVNPAPEKTPEHTVNEGPQPEPQPTANPGPEAPPEPPPTADAPPEPLPTANPGPEDFPEPVHVNEGPVDAPELEAAPEPKRVNTRPNQ